MVALYPTPPKHPLQSEASFALAGLAAPQGILGPDGSGARGNPRPSPPAGRLSRTQRRALPDPKTKAATHRWTRAAREAGTEPAAQSAAPPSQTEQSKTQEGGPCSTPL